MKCIPNTLTIFAAILLSSSATFSDPGLKGANKKQDDQITQGYVVHLEQYRTPDDETLEKMSKLPNLLVDYKWDKYNPKAFERIAAKLTNMQSLDLVGAGINDAGLTPIAKLKNLRNLILVDNPITDAGLVHLKDLTNLELLSLSLGNNITNDGLPNFAGLKNLHTLVLAGNPGISDSGLVHFQGLTNLKVLNLKSTKVTEEGAAQLKVFLPNTKILLK